MVGALDGLRVLDLSRVLAGPWAAQLLADLGAEVIKVERRDGGDDTRGWGPPYLADDQGNPTTEAAYYLSANRNKKSVTVDFKTPQGQAIVRALAGCSDILIENFKVGALKAYGLDFETLSALHPGLIYCSITGFGQTGPYATRPGYDFLIQGMGGLMSVTGRGDGEPGAGPQKVGVALVDILTGLYSTTGILAAVAQRSKTGRGQHVDVALLDVEVACLANQALNYLVSGVVPQRMGNAHPNIVPYQDFPTLDGYMIVTVGNDAQFARLCLEGGRPELVDDARFVTNSKRVENRHALTGLLEAMTRTRTTAEWVRRLEVAGVPCGPINRLDAVFADPQVHAREMQIELDHPTAGHVPLVACPVRLSETPAEYHSAPPTLGQHTREVLCGLLDMSQESVESLAAQGII